LLTAIKQGRIEEDNVGPTNLNLTLYEAPPDPVGILFENGLRFHGADVVNDNGLQVGPTVRRLGEKVSLRLWWSIDYGVTASQDYNIALYLTPQKGEAQLVELSTPQLKVIPSLTSTKESDNFYLDARDFTMPDAAPVGTDRGLLTGDYTIELSVLDSQGTTIAAPQLNQNKRLPIGDVFLKTW
jgi:hypothetical protein